MAEIIIIILLIIMLLPSTSIKLETKWFQYEYNAKRMYGFHKELLKLFKNK